MLAREGSPVLAAVALAALAFVSALRFRSWPWWLAGYALTLFALSLAWAYRGVVGVSK